MQKFLTSLVLLLCLTEFTVAQDTIIDGPRRVPPHKLCRLEVKNVPVKTGTFWSIYPAGKVDIAKMEKGSKLIQFVGPPGEYTVEVLLITVDENGVPGLDKVSVQVILEGEIPPTPPTPPGPNPPGPTPPGPNPPDPTPPGPAPIPTDGFRVLIVYETDKQGNISPKANSVLFSKTIRDYLNEKCVVGPDGRTREYRIWDQDLDVSVASDIWKKAFQRPRSQVPWILISNGRNGFEGPLPTNVQDTLTLLKKYGG